MAVCAMAMMFMFPLATFSGTNDRNVEVKAELNLIAKDNQRRDRSHEPEGVYQGLATSSTHLSLGPTCTGQHLPV